MDKTRNRQGVKHGVAGRKHRTPEQVVPDALEWLPGPVPWGFWNDRENRRRYMHWLGRMLGYDHPDDWYQVRCSDFRKNYGNGLLKRFSTSPIGLLRDFLPNRNWKEWLFSQVPLDFWNSQANRLRYMQWLARRLGFQSSDDWYGISVQSFRENAGLGLLSRFTNSPTRAVMGCFPEVDWKEWRFSAVPPGFWVERSNRVRYLQWLETELEIGEPDDWYNVKQADFFSRHGTSVLQDIYRGSPGAAAKDLYPRHCWYEWLFSQVPNGFWKTRANRRRYMKWLGEQIGVRQPSHWQCVTRQHFYENAGRHLLDSEYERSVHKAVCDYLPQYKWRPHAFSS